MTIQAMAAQRQAIYELFDTDITDDDGDVATMELARLNRAILVTPAACAEDVTTKMRVWGDIMQDYGDGIVDGQAELWASLTADVASFAKAA
ncbi:hypothetical protein [Aquamicrobium zhengzhouense]|uniref:Uncharacterized protein n=1 Tax=Aquamicrobium zhengzhouense TaxID=2781738 RepID=A0ABS0SBX7_9HYPH|nr:hypothetical protein [Aquamicrobium zhengzhouense]MBI1620793.1 hypothetical protein [Aquamicrobium zhengzhouense]